jgi:hypothetical protein
MTQRRDEAVRAFEQADELTVRRLGWWPVWQARATWWAPVKSCTAREMIPLVKLLGDEDSARVLEAHRELATNKWQPTPAENRGHLIAKTAKGPQSNVGLSRDRAATLEALKATAAAWTSGERLCKCGPPIAGKWDPRPDGVLRCARRFRPDLDDTYGPGCGGLEPGQLNNAIDAGLLNEEAA